MIPEYPSPNAAARLFLTMLITRAYDGAIDETTSLLENGPAWRKAPKELLAIHRWYQSLDSESRSLVLAVVKEAVDSAIFGSLVLLDGAWGGNPIEDQTSDFALSLQIYSEDNMRASNSPQVSIRLNHQYTSHEDLHDMFKAMIGERTKEKD